MKPRNSLRAAAALAAAALAITACGSSGSKAGSGSTTPSSPSTPSGTPLVIGVIYPDHNQIIEEPQTSDTVKAAEAYFNAKGGVAGHPLQMVTCNDQADPNVAAQCATQMVSDKAIAVIGWSLFDSGIVPVLTTAKIPYFPVIPNQPANFNTPGVFDVQAGTAQLVAAGLLAQKAGANKLDLFTIQTNTTASLTQLVASGLKAVGASMGKTLAAPPTAVDYSSYVAQISAPAVDVTLPAAGMVPFTKAYQQAGSTAKLITTPGVITAQVIQQTGGASTPLNGALLYSPFPAPTDSAWNTLTAALKYAPTGSLANLEDQTTQGVWVTMLVLKQVLSSGLPDLSSAGLLSALNSATDINTGGLTPTLDFAQPFQPPYSRVFNRAAYLLTIKAGQFVSLDNGAPHDLTNALLGKTS